MADTLSPPDPDFERRVRASFGAQGVMGHLGAWLTQVAPGQIAIELPFSKRLTQQQGLFHGGVIGMIADSSAGYACLTLLPKGVEVVSIEFKINFLRPAKGELLRAEGSILKVGRTVSVARSDVHCVHQGEAKLCASLLASFAVVAE